MKVVVNTCFGGFGLSLAAVRLYFKKKGWTLYTNDDNGLVRHYYTKPEHMRDDDDDGYFSPHRDIARDDPVLIEVIKELGKKANGSHAALALVDHPDDIPWIIEEYDGHESLHYDMSLYQSMLELSFNDEGMKDLLDRCKVYYALKKDTE